MGGNFISIGKETFIRKDKVVAAGIQPDGVKWELYIDLEGNFQITGIFETKEQATAVLNDLMNFIDPIQNDTETIPVKVSETSETKEDDKQ